MRNTSIKRLGMIVAGLVAFASIAFALTSPPSYSLRQVPFQTTTHFRVLINWNDGNIAAGVKVGSIPDKAFIAHQYCHVLIAFNQTPTNSLTVGTTQTGSQWLAAGSTTNTNCNLTSATYQPLQAAAGMGMNVTNAVPTTGTTGGWDLWVRYPASTTVGTAGQVVYIIEYVPNDDL